ncbi:MAG: sulfite exporter TauE/SafE family protein [Chloroflexota bacterium]|nr:sulfite exporter TauE/SafE family protein [Chloroflexota bacterium]
MGPAYPREYPVAVSVISLMGSFAFTLDGRDGYSFNSLDPERARMKRSSRLRRVALCLLLLFFLFSSYASAQTDTQSLSDSTVNGRPWWYWPLLLFIVSFLIGIVAVLGGIGGGSLFVCVVASFFPFHLDFIRATGLFMALASSLSAGPSLLRFDLASLRLAMPLALVGSIASTIGAMIGLALPTNVVRISLGVAIMGVSIFMLTAKKSRKPDVEHLDKLSAALRIRGVYRDRGSGERVTWRVHKTPQGLLFFIFVGMIGGMFGMGGGWASVPTINLVMGAPLKISVATSSFLLSITDAAAAWVYLNNGAIIPMILVPSIVGIMLGGAVGARLLRVARPTIVRWIVIGILAFSGLRIFLQGLGL